MRLFVKLVVMVKVVDMVTDFQFPQSELSPPERSEAHPQQDKELSRRGRSLHQQLFLSREARSDKSNHPSTPSPFPRMLEHSWQPQADENICSSDFVPSICACISGW